MEKYNDITGLTPQQEKAVVLLASGNNVTDTAKQLKIERSTIYQWSERENFQAYYNMLCKEIQSNTKNCLFGLLDDAFNAIKESLNSENPNVRLKAALSVIDRTNIAEIGLADPIELIRRKCTEKTMWDVDCSMGEKFDEDRFDKLLHENNLKEK